MFTETKFSLLLLFTISMFLASKCHDHEPAVIEKQEKVREEENPYYFEARSFEPAFAGEAGNISVLQRFSNKSELLNSIDNYRLSILESNPGGFMIPHHSDAETVFVVTNGRGILTRVYQHHRQAFYVQRGDVVRVPVGVIIYLINYDNNEKLRLLLFFKPINIPYNLADFFSSGGQFPETFYRAFSKKLLEAALKVPRATFNKLFEKFNGGVIIKASQEQVTALIQDEGHGGESEGPFNLLQQQPSFSNKFGQYFEATPDTFEQLKDLDYSVAFMNISRGAMIVPYYNTRSTKIVTVVGGKGHFEIISPLATNGFQYERFSARLSVDDVFIVPAGHPVSIVSSGYEDLQLVFYGVNALNSNIRFLAGGDNIWSQIHPAAKELSFDTQVTEVDEVFDSQPTSYFVPGPKHSQRRGEGNGYSVASILDFIGHI